MQDVLRALAFIGLFGMVFIGAMLIEAWYLKRKTGDANYSIPESLTNMVTGASYKIVDGIAIALFIQAFYMMVYEYGLQWNPEISWYSVLALVLFTDFLFYITHLITHKVRWFWGTHVTHHSSNRMNLSTALRQNFTSALNGNWMFWWVPLALVGFDKNWALIAIESNLVYQFFLHTEAVNRLGWLEKVFNTPSHHRVHHGSNPAQIDRNFGGMLIIWDKLFGTFRDESEAGEIRYGISRMPKKPLNPWHLQTYEYVAMAKDLWRYKDPRILFKHPEWARDHYGTQHGYEDAEVVQNKKAEDIAPA
ncbi:MAG: sterol desaturase family protein [Pseudomonadota bacterium]